ncbi:hypothetical protein HJFPF1_00800 [Paramyrothecium foliicola]|nr:hypothetical protein HJFPF1_00800 [Paramyrothecium foliicola]
MNIGGLLIQPYQIHSEATPGESRLALRGEDRNGSRQLSQPMKRGLPEATPFDVEARKRTQLPGVLIRS